VYISRDYHPFYQYPIVTCMSDSRWGFGLEIGFIDHLQAVTTNNFNTIANFHNLQITTTHAKSVFCVFIRPSMVTACNSADSSTAPTKSSPHRLSYNYLPYNWLPSLQLTQCFNKLPGWRPFHTNLLVFSFQNAFNLTPDFQMTTDSFRWCPRYITSWQGPRRI
jgi:hypothetical protein